LFLPTEITHNDRGKHHQDLRDLTGSETRLIAYFLNYRRLVAPQDVTQYSAGVGLSRRSRVLTSEDHAAKSAEVTKNAAIMVLFQSGIQALGTLRCRGIVCQTTENHRQRRLYCSVNCGRLCTHVLADLIDGFGSLLLTK